jgi:hypothetical protein
MRELTHTEVNSISGGNVIAFFSTLIFSEAYAPYVAIPLGAAVGIVCGLPVVAFTTSALTTLAVSSTVSSAAAFGVMGLMTYQAVNQEM